MLVHRRLPLSISSGFPDTLLVQFTSWSRDRLIIGFDPLNLHMSPVAHTAGAYLCFCSMKQLGVLLLHLDGMLVHCISSGYPDSSLVPIYTPVWRGTVRVKCLAQEHNARAPVRALTRAFQMIRSPARYP